MHPIAHARETPDKAACILADSGRAMSYAELERRANQAAHLFRSVGLRRGDVVAVLLDNGFEIFEAAWAAQRSGLYLTSISTRLSAPDIAYILADSGAKLVVAADRFEDSLAAQGPVIPRLFAGRPFAKGDTWSAALDACPTTAIDDPSPGADMLYSSGTTGRPKGVKPSLPEGDVQEPTPLATMGQTLYAMTGETIYLSTSPLYHAAPLRWAMAVQRLGGTVVVQEKFDAEDCLRLIEAYRITHGTWVPTHFIRLLKLPPEIRLRYDVSSLRAAIHAAAPCPVATKQAMLDWWGPIIHEYYSGTEFCGMTAISAEEWLRKPGSVGKAVLGTLKITDGEGAELPPGREGMVYFADGPRFAYHNDPAKTREAYDRNGWATLGDIGRLDEDGYLFLTDRKAFMIISGGVNIYPQEIENVLVTHPAVYDVAVIGAPDEDMGERVVAIIQPSRWDAAGPELAEELRSFAYSKLGGLKCPRTFDFREQLPRDPTGKLIKRLLRDAYSAKAGG